MHGRFSDVGAFHSTAMLFAALILIALFLLPARVIQKRHGYPAWVLVFGLIPYLGPNVLLWAFATSELGKTEEVPQ
ncbi:hypothetical protein ACXYMO_12375 [Arenibacterium sp. CAU 1754]